MTSGRGFIGYLLMQVLEMPYLAWAWMLVLVACLLFTMLDDKKIVGIPQGIYAATLIAVFFLRGVEKMSAGYWAIWLLGCVGLGTYLYIKLVNQQAEEF